MNPLGSVFPQIFTEKFKKSPFLLTPLGFIYNKQVYLYLDDLNIFHDLGHILDVYRQFEVNKNNLLIEVPGYHERSKFCSCWNMFKEQNETYFCCDCNKYICLNCSKDHPKHNIGTLCMPRCNACSCCGKYNMMPVVWYKRSRNKNKSETLICYDCLPHNSACSPEYLQLTEPVINFNIAEWIPIRGFLENRNINSPLYGRKLSYYFSGDIIKLNLIHQSVPYDINYDSTILADIGHRLAERFNLSDVLMNKILDYVDYLYLS